MADIIGTSGNDHLQGSGADDRIFGREGNDVIFADAGNDQVFGEGGDDYLVGADGNDTLSGGTGSDEISGLDGEDIIQGEDGSDIMKGGRGSDEIEGGEGNDTIEGDGPISSSILGEDGNDTLGGGAGNDSIHGGGGNDTISGGTESDSLRGGQGQDHVDGGDGNDYLTGFGEEGYGFDIETDVIIGGNGNDQIYAGYGDAVDGGEGSDSLSLNLYAGATAGITADFRDLANNGMMTVGGATLKALEYVTYLSLTQFDDIIVAGAISDGVTGIELSGWGGNDTLTGTVGVDNIYGGDGDDVLRGGGGTNPTIYPAGDRLIGEGGNDIIYVGNDGATASGGTGDDDLHGGAGTDSLYGDDGVDTIHAGEGNDDANGGYGNDFIDGGDGDDFISGGDDDDLIISGDGADQISGDAGDDIIYLGAHLNAVDSISGGAGFDQLVLQGNYNSVNLPIITNIFQIEEIIVLGAADGSFNQDSPDTIYDYYLDLANSVVFSSGTLTVSATTLAAGEALHLDASSETSAAYTVFGGKGQDHLQTGGGNDSVQGGGGDDSLEGGAGDDRLQGGVDDDSLEGGAGDDNLNGGEGLDTASYRSATSAVTVNLAAGALQNTGGAGIDTLVGFENLTGSNWADTFSGDESSNALDGGEGGDFLYGNGGNDTFYGGDGNDVISGGYGNDIIDAGRGQDNAFGGSGDDVFRSSVISINSPDSLYYGGDGTDTFDYSGATSSLYFRTEEAELNVLYVSDNRIEEIERIIGGQANDILSFSHFTRDVEAFGGEGDDFFDGGRGADQFFGESGADNFSIIDSDSAVGGEGDDQFSIIGAFHDASASGLVEGGGGHDTLRLFANFAIDLEAGTANSSSAAYEISSIEIVLACARQGLHTTVLGSDAAEILSVNHLANDGSVGVTFDGRAGEDQLFGSKGNDDLVGGAGDDVIEGGVGDDEIDGGQGVDTASYASATSVTVSLAVSGAQSSGGAGSDTLIDIENLVGSAFADTLTGDAGNNVLDSGGGEDWLYGGLGSDSFYVDSWNDVVFETAGEGYDQIFARSSYALHANVAAELLTAADQADTQSINLAGNGFDQDIVGNDGNNILRGGGGDDWFTGRAGDDRFDVDSVNDRVFEAAAGGHDSVYSSVSYRLGEGTHVEVLSVDLLSGTTAINLTGNSLDQQIWANFGDNFLRGGGGADILLGLSGDDRFFVTDGRERIIESAAGGVDAIYASVSFALNAGAHVEMLSSDLLGGVVSLALTGNELSQQIWGNFGNNMLKSGGGADTLLGLQGDDSYFISQGSEAVVETAEGGNDALYASVDYTLGEGVYVEILSAEHLGGTEALYLTGNELHQEVWGNMGDNILDGKDGRDTLYGLAGQDIFLFTSAISGNVDTVADFASGTDRIGLLDDIFTELSAGYLGSNAFREGSVAQDADDRILFDSSSGNLFYDADGAGEQQAELFAILQPGTTLTATDFVIL